ncbi:murein DD-endopeptidase MepM/ murein hydrolase activator NlpD [Arcanobacterium wilhelmae]|uniref:Murein DD-endopeptidase MepM/ murein hydrolase activator NlpD n=1 Tax=Arcanobacterium wilhelmae TaxID=1803177 RepID=A0ABT9N9X5_9ACTO|nr:M23 family metallopeptidase [Arcanobacterium wilhelmae]MDP9800519.1 murein DD-endopeptidase MepM/ murein hydrolase activator NlpD [Arcanobacterium wilhelmae]WFN89936.1 M23 family metallopeptidase [Arcanobacterium wilhelmae]
MGENRTLPSRKELRLARLAAEKAAAENAVPVEEAPATEPKLSPARGADQAPSEPEPQAEPRITHELFGGMKLLGAVRRYSVKGMALTASAVFGISVMGGLLVSRVSTVAAATDSQSVLNTVATQTTATTPEELKAKAGAEEESRLRDVEQMLAVAPGEFCKISSGANSVASAFFDTKDALIYPLAVGQYRLTSNYGGRSDPFTGESSFHLGQDFAAPAGTPVYAVADGVVIHAGEGVQGRSSNLIVVQHERAGKKFTSWYVHMWDDGVLVKEGDKVKIGQQIAKVGSNGYSTGPHLHFEVHPGEGLETDTTNPLTFLRDNQARDIASLCF